MRACRASSASHSSACGDRLHAVALSALNDGGALHFHRDDRDVVSTPADGAAMAPGFAALVLQQPGIELLADAGDLQLATFEIPSPESPRSSRGQRMLEVVTRRSGQWMRIQLVVQVQQWFLHQALGNDRRNPVTSLGS